MENAQSPLSRRLALDKSSDEATILHALTVCGSHTAT